MNTPFPAAPTIQNRSQLETVVDNIVDMQRERAELVSAQEREMAAIRLKYDAPLAELDRLILLETNWIETWARNNPVAFSNHGTLPCAQAVLSFRYSPPRIARASRKWTWTAIALKLGEVAWGKRYLRVPPLEVNRTALLADQDHFTPDELRLVGVKIVQDERFVITPHGQEKTIDWQEAA